MVSKARRGVLDDSALTPALLHASDEDVYRLLGVKPADVPDALDGAARDGHVASVREETQDLPTPHHKRRADKR
jgi:hypothetical protein